MSIHSVMKFFLFVFLPAILMQACYSEIEWLPAAGGGDVDKDPADEWLWPDGDDDGSGDGDLLDGDGGDYELPDRDAEGDEYLSCEEEIGNEVCPGGTAGDGRTYLVCKGDTLTACHGVLVEDPCGDYWRTRFEDVRDCEFACAEDTEGQAYCNLEEPDGDEDSEALGDDDGEDWETDGDLDLEDAEEDGDIEAELEIEIESDIEQHCSISGFVYIADQSNHAGTIIELTGDAYRFAETAQDGSFEFTDLEIGSYILRYTHEYTVADNDSIVIEFTQYSDYPVDIWLYPAGWIQGKVRIDGAEAEGAIVQVPGTDIIVISDANGNYKTGLIPAASYTLAAAYPGYQTQIKEGVKVYFGTAAIASFDLEPYSSGGSGSVEGWADLFNSDNNSGTTATLTGAKRFETGTDASGHFLFTDIPTGSYVLRLTHQGYRPMEIPYVIVTPDSHYTVDKQTLQYGKLRHALSGPAQLYQTNSQSILLFATYDHNQRGDIFSLPVTDGEARLLAEDVYVESYVNYSPDGTGVIYKRNFDSSTNSYDLYWTEFQGTRAEHLIDEDIVQNYTYDFSYGLIYFKRSSETSESFDLFRYDFELQSSVRLSSNVHRNLYMESDGRHFLVLRNFDNASESADLYRLDIQTQEETLLHEDIYAYLFTIGTNGKKLAVSKLTDKSGNLADLIVVDLETLSKTIVANDIQPDYLQFGRDDTVLYTFRDMQEQVGDMLEIAVDGSGEQVLAENIYRYNFHWENDYTLLTCFPYDQQADSYSLAKIDFADKTRQVIDTDVYPGYLYDMAYKGLLLYFKNFDQAARSGDLWRWHYDTGAGEAFLYDVNSDFLRFQNKNGTDWIYYLIDYQAQTYSGELWRSELLGSLAEYVDTSVNAGYSFLPDGSLLYLSDYGQQQAGTGNLQRFIAADEPSILLEAQVANAAYKRSYWGNWIFIAKDGACFSVSFEGSDKLKLYDKAAPQFSPGAFVQSAPEKELFVVIEQTGAPEYMPPGIWEIKPPWSYDLK